MKFDFDAFYAERNKRLNIPDEDVQEYTNRVRTSSGKSRRFFAFPYNDISQAWTHPPDATGLGRHLESHFDNFTPPRDSTSTKLLAVPSALSPVAKEVDIAPGQHEDVDKDTGIAKLLMGERTFVFPNADGVLEGATNMKQSNDDDEDAPVNAREKFREPSSRTLRNRIPSANEVIPWSSNQHRVSEAGHAAQLEKSARAPDEHFDLPASPIEDVNETMDSSKSSNDLGSIYRPVRGRSSSDVRPKVSTYSPEKFGKLIKLGMSKVSQVESEIVQRRKSPSDVSSIEDSSSPTPPSPVLVPSGESVAVVVATAVNRSKADVKKVKARKDKEKAKQVLPEQYATTLMDSVQSGLYSAVRKKYIQILEGKNIFYTGGDMRYVTERTRSRMDIIVRHGGTLIPKFSSSTVTHIVTDAHQGPTLRALGLKRLGDIPDHIPTVKWSWVVSCIGTSRGDARLDECWMHAAFSERIDAGVPKIETKRKISDTVDISRISEFTFTTERAVEANPIEDISEFPASDNGQESPFIHSRRFLYKSMANEHDPLEQFYEKARADRESDWVYHSEDGDVRPESDCSGSGPSVKSSTISLPKRGWTCDKRERKIDHCPNQDVIDKLKELMEIHRSRLGDEDKWRVFSYSKATRALSGYPHRIKTASEASSIPGIGEKTAQKIMEIIETGQLRRIEYENTDDIKVTRLYQGVYGVGQSTAYQWFSAGCKTLEDLLAGKGGVKLTPAQEIGIKFYDDINSRMARDEARAIFDLIKPIALQLDPKLFVEIMGSFRRGKADCGDVDILITRPTDDGKTHAGILSRLLRELHAVELLTEDLALPEDSDDLEAVYRGLCRLPKEGSKRRRIDFLTVPWQSRGAALLYYTGDDIFNRAMRYKARVMGYSLNQRGLFAGVVRDPHDRSKKTNPGLIIASETEEEIFRILGVPWQEPHERVRG